KAREGESSAMVSASWKLRGRGLSTRPCGPSPAPVAPWQAAQLLAKASAASSREGGEVGARTMPFCSSTCRRSSRAASETRSAGVWALRAEQAATRARAGRTRNTVRCMVSRAAAARTGRRLVENESDIHFHPKQVDVKGGGDFPPRLQELGSWIWELNRSSSS